MISKVFIFRKKIGIFFFFFDSFCHIPGSNNGWRWTGAACFRKGVIRAHQFIAVSTTCWREVRGILPTCETGVSCPRQLQIDTCHGHLQSPSVLCHARSRPAVSDPTDCSPPGSSVHGILQARILEWVAMPSCRRSSQLRDYTCISYVSCIGRQILYHMFGCMYTPDTKITYILTFLFTTLEQFLRALWNAVSWAIVLILPQIKLNLQLSHCAFYKRKYHTSFYTSPTAHWSLEVLDGWDLFYLYTLTAIVPTPVFLPGESQGWGSLVSCRLWGRTELDTTEAT